MKYNMKNKLFGLILGLFFGMQGMALADNPVPSEGAEKIDGKITIDLPEPEKAVDDVVPALKIPSKAETLEKIAKSLNAIRTLKADFIQRAPDGSVMEGVLYLERPGKLRFDYGKDAAFLLVSNGKLLTFVDYEVKQVNRWPIKKTPLGILVDDEITFDSKVEVPDIIRFAGLLKVPVIDPKRQEYGYIILIFEESTMELRAWESVDAQGYTTRVALVNPEYNVPIDKKQFTFKDPRPSKRGPRRR